MRARPVIRVPYLDEDVHDLAGLMEINRYLFAAGAKERAAIAAPERARLIATAKGRSAAPSGAGCRARFPG